MTRRLYPARLTGTVAAPPSASSPSLRVKPSCASWRHRESHVSGVLCASPAGKVSSWPESPALRRLSSTAPPYSAATVSSAVTAQRSMPSGASSAPVCRSAPGWI